MILHVLKFCEPELFDVPAIRAGLRRARRAGAATLEGELEAELSGQTVTRIEAFVEMLARRGRAA